MAKHSGQGRKVLLGGRVPGRDLEAGPDRNRGNLTAKLLRESTPASQLTGVEPVKVGDGSARLGSMAGTDEVHCSDSSLIHDAEGILLDQFRFAVLVTFSKTVANMEPVRHGLRGRVDKLDCVRNSEPGREDPRNHLRAKVFLRSRGDERS